MTRDGQDLIAWEKAGHKQATDSIYSELTESFNVLQNEFDGEALERLSVEWATETRSYGSEYKVVGFSSDWGEVTMLIEGKSNGGRYEIRPKPANPPWIRYVPPPESSSGSWKDPLKHLKIKLDIVDYGTGPEGKLEYLKNRIPSQLLRI